MDDFQHFDDYAVLGVSPGATPEMIKQAYRREISKYHPDRFRSADPQTQQYARERSQRITEAYAALTRNPRARTQPRRVPPTNVEQLAADYERAQSLLAAGDALEAARLLRQIQRVDPFYRDVDTLLAHAEAQTAHPAARHPLRRPAAWLVGGALGLLLLGGGAYGWNALRAPLSAEVPPTGTPGAIAGAGATSGPTVETTATTIVAEAPTAPSASAAPAVGETLIAGGEQQPTSVPPTEVVPTATRVPPPTEVVPTPTSVPPTEVVPTATRVPPPTEVVPTSTRVPLPPAPRPTQPPQVARTPVPPRVVGVENGPVVAANNFSDPASGWPVLQTPTYSLGYRNGVYVITAQPNTGAVFAYGSPLGQNNALIGADVIPVRGAAGLMFGPNNSYRFVISGDGRFRVEQRGRVLVRPTASNAIRAGRNRLVVAVAGTRVSLYANGVLLSNINVPAPLKGTTYGFVVIPGAGGGEGIFDSLTVRAIQR